jgi:hypothetical protein
VINLVLTLPISCAMQKPTGIIALLDEAWYVAQHYKLSFFYRLADWQIGRFQIPDCSPSEEDELC